MTIPKKHKGNNEINRPNLQFQGEISIDNSYRDNFELNIAVCGTMCNIVNKNFRFCASFTKVLFYPCIFVINVGFGHGLLVASVT